MQPGYGGEIQQFLVEGCTSSSLFPISAAASSGGTALHHPHLQHQNQQHQTHFPPHFQPMPMTQQLFHQTHYFQLFNHPAAAAAAAPPPPQQEMGLDLESGPENSASFLTAAAVSFKLGVNESSGGGSREGLNDDEAILHGDDGSESHVHPWQREEESAIKEPFWRPLDIDYINRNNKRCKEKQLEEAPAKYCKKSKEGDEQQEHGNTSGTNNYKLFSELEAIYKPGSNTSAANPTGSSSALTGENPLLNPAPPGPPSEQHINHGSDTSTGEEVLVKKYSKTTGGSSSSSRRKRKRRQQQLSSVAAFVKTLVKQLMEHQEGLHRKFLEVMERRDQERATREETWRRQEAAKSRREAAARAQERALAAAREAAIISFLEKITGESINLPSKPQFPSELVQEPSPKEENSGANPLDHSDGFLNNNVADKSNNSNNNNNNSSSSNLIQMNSSRWPKAEVQALIRVRSGLESRFQEPGLKGPLWEEVTSAMAAMGYSRSAKRCKEKWENINKYFRKTKESGKKRPAHSKTCPYFQQLDQLYSKFSHKLPPAAASDASGIALKDNSELLDAIVVPAERSTFKFSEMRPMRLDFNRSGKNDESDAAGREDHDQNPDREDEGEEGEGSEDGGIGGKEQEMSHANGHEGFHKVHDPTLFFQRLES